MKFALIVLAVLASVSSSNTLKLPTIGSGALAKELQDFVDLTPIDKIVEICRAYMAKDPEFQAAIELLHSNTMKELVTEIQYAPEMRKLMGYMAFSGLNVYLMVYKLKAALSEPIPPHEATVEITGTIQGLLKDIEDVIPADKLSTLMEMKQKYSRVFDEYAERATSPEVTAFFFGLSANPNLQKLAQQAEQAGINKDVFENNLYLLTLINAAVVHL